MIRVIRVLNRFSFRAWLGLWLALLFFGAMYWAKGRDPFSRVWFKVKTKDSGKADCIAVLPKTAPKPLPVIVYLHGSAGSFLSSGNELRAMAEMGIAVVGMDYNQTNEATCEAQFAALNAWVRKQKWADTNRMAWVGFSLGAGRITTFALDHPESQPSLLIRISGSEVRSQNADVRSPTTDFRPPTVLLLHGERDVVFPILLATNAAAALRSNGFREELKTFPGQSHSFDPNRLVLFRGIGEDCLKFFSSINHQRSTTNSAKTINPAFGHYQSILTWQENAKPLWLFWIPAGLWAIGWCYSKRTSLRSVRPSNGEKVSGTTNDGKRLHREVALGWVVAILATLAVGQTALHLVPPRFEITPRLLELARNHLIAPKEVQDFDCLSTNAFWQGKKLKTLLTHMELANYNRELINWKLDDELYRQFVLSPEISPNFDGTMHWRRWLWESFYPRIRKENSPEASAEIIVRHLRERVTIEPGFDSPKSIEQIWIRQITNEEGFEAIYVAALRSAGIPARLSAEGKIEFHNGAEWKPAPRPML